MCAWYNNYNFAWANQIKARIYGTVFESCRAVLWAARDEHIEQQRGLLATQTTARAGYTLLEHGLYGTSNNGTRGADIQYSTRLRKAILTAPLASYHARIQNLLSVL